MNSINDSFKFYSLGITPERMVKHQDNKDYVKWPKNIVSDPRI